MAVFRSTQLVSSEADPSVQVPARDNDARKRVAVFIPQDITGLVATDTIRLGTLRKGWRLLGMKIVIPANWLAATSTISLGITGTVAKYLSAGVVGAAAVQLDANNTSALLFGTVLAADEELMATINTAGAGTTPAGPAVILVEYSRD